MPKKRKSKWTVLLFRYVEYPTSRMNQSFNIHYSYKILGKSSDSHTTQINCKSYQFLICKIYGHVI